MANLKPDTETGMDVKEGIVFNLNEAVVQIRDNILALTTISLVTFFAQVINFQMSGVSLSPLTPEILSALSLLIGLPLFAQVILRVAQSSNRLLKAIVSKNKALIGLFVIPYIVYLITNLPFQVGQVPFLTFQFLLAYGVVVLTYLVYILFRKELPQDADFTNELVQASIPAAVGTTILLMTISVTIRLFIL